MITIGVSPDGAFADTSPTTTTTTSPVPTPPEIPGQDLVDVPGSEEAVPGAVREAVVGTPLEGVLGVVGGKYDEATDNTTTTTTTTTTTPTTTQPVPSQAPSPATTEPAQAEPEDQSTEAEDEPEEEPSPHLTAKLAALRTLDGDGYLLPPVLLLSASWPVVPTYGTGYVDVPAGPRSSREIVDLLASAGATGEELAQVLAPFPVAGSARYSNDWGAPRHTPSPHAHEGTDIFASRGTPVVASFDGVVAGVGIDTAIGGNSVRVITPDGSYTYYAHLDGFSPAAIEGLSVTAGTVLGYVGSTGNAVGSPPHLHYEIHPGGGDPVPPLPYLDLWLQTAMNEARLRARATDVSGLGAGQAAVAPIPGFAPLAPFQPASSTDGSPVPGLAMLTLIGAGIFAYRRRDRFVVPVRAVWTRVEPLLPERFRRRRRVVPVRRFLSFPVGPSQGGAVGAPDPVEGRVMDVLEPLLSLRAERERVGSAR